MSQIEVVRINRCGEAVARIVGNFDRFLWIREGDYGQHRPKDLLTRDPHRVLYVFKQRWFEKVSASLLQDALAPQRDLSALLLPNIDIRHYLIEVPFFDQGADLCVDAQRVAYSP